MTELKNEFSWSVTRQRNFEECQRCYYLSYYAHWGGWEVGADALTKKCYQLTKMKNLDTWAGDIVHTTIEATLKRLRTASPISLDWMRDSALAKLRSGWKESKEKRWQDRPKQYLNLLEHYYDFEVPKERTDEIKNKVFLCLENFWSSDVFAFIKAVTPSEWKALEELQSFVMGGIKVWVRIDFAMSHQDVLYIYDWKSGREDEDDVRQLVCYALYAMDAWSVPYNRIKIIPVYLKGNLSHEHTLTPEQIIEAKEQIFQSASRMLSLLDDPRENRASKANFPMTTETRKCKRCAFQVICYGGRYEEKASTD